MSTSINLIANSSVLASAAVCVCVWRRWLDPLVLVKVKGVVGWRGGGCSGMSLRAFLGGSLEAFGAS